jgi:acetyl esterase
MSVDAELQPVVDLVNASEVPAPRELGAEGLRANFGIMCAGFGAGPAVASVEDRPLGLADGSTVGVRVYRPASVGDGPAPAVVWFHGGGFVLGTLDSHDQICRLLADGAGVVVVAVDYRLAPEHTFPAAADDAAAAVRAVVEQAGALGIDPGRVAVAGDSAGGNLAAVSARRCRGLVSFQLLVYPVCDLTHTGDRYPSFRDNAEGYVLTADTMAFFDDSYAPDPADRTHPDASPLLAPDLAGLAPALVLTAEFDPLRDEGEAYAARLADAGVPVTLSRYGGAIHMFFHMAEFTAIGRRAVDEAAHSLREHLHPG